ncbi:MCE family protein [Mycolicibacterium sp. HS_4_1]
MISKRSRRVTVGAVVALLLVAGITAGLRAFTGARHMAVVAYFDNSNGLFRGDDVRILGVRVGKVDAIEPQPQRVKVTFSVDSRYPVPADVKAVIISPSLVTARSIQLTPAYTSGPMLRTGEVIPQSRTAVPVEWDDLRDQLQKLSATLQPSRPGEVSALGAFINTTADNLRGQGANIRDTIITLSKAVSALGEHSTDMYGTVKNVSTLVTALQSSSELMSALNRNLAAVTGALAHHPDEIGHAVADLNTAVGDVQSFIANNKDALGTTSDKLAALTTTVNDSLDDIKQTLHVLPNTAANFVNVYDPAQSALTAIIAMQNFANPLMFLCGAVQAASRLGAEQAAKLCVQYLAPIVKNRQYNFLPVGLNPFVGTMARPNEVTYSEDWLRPNGSPPPPAAADSGGVQPAAAPPGPLAAEAPAPAAAPGPSKGLPAMMLPTGEGS